MEEKKSKSKIEPHIVFSFTWFYIFIILVSGDPDIIDAIVHYIMNANLVT